MRTVLAPLVLVLLFSCNAYAQKYVVELEGFVFDRRTTDAERKTIEKLIQDIPGEERNAARANENIGLLQQRAGQLYHFKSTVLASMAEPVSQKLDTDRMDVEANFTIQERIENVIKVDCQIAAGYMLGKDQACSSTSGASITVRLGTRTTVSQGGGEVKDGNGKIRQSHEHFMTLLLREATQEDLKPRKLSDKFHDNLLKKRNAIPAFGGKLSMR